MEVLSMRGRTLVVDATGVDCPVKETNHFKDLTAAGEHQGGKPNAVFMGETCPSAIGLRE
jgi:hypothetical protein